jgi:hypothetical protein
MAEWEAFGKKWTEFTKKRSDLLKDVKSWRLFANVLGGPMGGYVEMWEFENLATAEKVMGKMMQDKEFVTEIYASFIALTVPGTHSMSIWNPVA